MKLLKRGLGRRERHDIQGGDNPLESIPRGTRNELNMPPKWGRGGNVADLSIWVWC